jgi:prepilin-type N-terminal cleavage/methylation domain-containing protein
MFKVKNGFTLIELLIVIVIIGILAGIVVGIIGTNATNKSQDAKEKSVVSSVQNALEQYFLDNNSIYPAAADVATMKTDLVNAKLLTSTTDVTGLTYAHTTSPEGYTLSFPLKNQNDSGDNVTGTSPNKVYQVTAQQQ